MTDTIADQLAPLRADVARVLDQACKFEHQRAQLEHQRAQLEHQRAQLDLRRAQLDLQHAEAVAAAMELRQKERGAVAEWQCSVDLRLAAMEEAFQALGATFDSTPPSPNVNSDPDPDHDDSAY